VSASRLENLAYQMLGSVADAEDVVQEAQLRLLKQDASPDNEEAWLFRVVTNLSLDRLRARKRQREIYPGPWLPEPLPTVGPEDVVELADSLSMGLLLMLERLSPAERVVFVLREAFDLGYDDIAALVDGTAAACRQRYRRARANLAGERRFDSGDEGSQRLLLEKLLATIAARDFEATVELFHEDCVAFADGGGVVSAAIRPVTDPARIATVTQHIAHKLAEEGEVQFDWVRLNGGVGMLVSLDGQIVSTVQAEVRDGQIFRLFIMRNPEKLTHLAG
jgi:RNA polymerase sigma-70 factor (ECF subfamily)